VIERMTAGTALYDLPIPRIAPGEPANLCLVDLAAKFEVGAAGYVSKSANCCFHGRTLHGRVVLTIAAGTIAFRERMLAEAGRDHVSGASGSR
jgi:dihydroorotase